MFDVIVDWPGVRRIERVPEFVSLEEWEESRKQTPASFKDLPDVCRWRGSVEVALNDKIKTEMLVLDSQLIFSDSISIDYKAVQFIATASEDDVDFVLVDMDSTEGEVQEPRQFKIYLSEHQKLYEILTRCIDLHPDPTNEDFSELFTNLEAMQGDMAHLDKDYLDQDNSDDEQFSSHTSKHTSRRYKPY